MSNNFPELVSSATRALAAGRLDEARGMAEEALRLESRSTDAMLILGMVAEKLNQHEDAISHLMQLAALDPTSFHALLLLSKSLRAHGRTAEARDWARKAVAISAREPQGQNQLGLCCLSLHEWDEAIACFTRAIRLAPNVAAIHDNLGVAFQGSGQNVQAIRAFTRSLELQPKQIKVLGHLGDVLMNQLDHEGAAECARRMLEIDPTSANAHMLLAMAFQAENKPEEALVHARTAAAHAPNEADVAAKYGVILQASGDLEESSRQFERSLELEARQGLAYLGLVQNRRVTDPLRQWVEEMEARASDLRLAPGPRAELQYACGKAKDDLGEYEAAMKHFNEANRLTREFKFGARSFDRQRYKNMIDASIQHLDQEQFDRWAGTGSSSELPIFVVGMIRTGTTLVEQVLSSHPDIGGAGEQRFWVQRVKPGATASGFKQYASLPEEYLSKLQAISPGQKRVVDKMPDNFLLLGFLHRVFPEARIIYVSRHPVDTCLSIWSTPNRSRLDWANRKADIVFVQRQHERLAAHWRSILPPNRFLEVRYEELVTNQEPVSRRMIEFCGQEWHDSCLRPQDNPRAVSTPSALQVRRPMFKTSIERWRKYEPWLGEFADLLPKG